MRNIDDIIFAVFNEENLNSDEEKLLSESNIDIYHFYNADIEFQPEILIGLNLTLKNRIKDIKTFSTCKECNKEYRKRYKYRPYLECYDIEFCDECIKNFALDYISLRRIEKCFTLANEEYNKLDTYFNNKFNKITDILMDVAKRREEIGKWMSEYSKNYSMRIDKLTAYYEIVGNTVSISHNLYNGEILNSLSDIEQFNILKVKYDSDCKNIELRFEDYSKREYYFKTNKKGSFNWIVPKGMSLKVDSYYDGDYENSDFYFE
ncbi:TPA: hypothetical protein LA827_002845 [Clostridium botulinum]|uniref:Uncharacterized protein n=2 Tax=Clostridium botulinum TaxID=1491 RepID=A0A126JJ86_CLOBO|nr:hypothetical protein [Clostridium botulinum]ALT05646.1 hypothetical protein [Clostridium botulinum]ALT05746.1 hypothetical protein [Clostridium botulinum]ALT05848.1 hypothetical protein [Clostridium botulinum]HBJ2623060.1 hypothetical protein [Clostridium botulinum]